MITWSLLSAKIWIHTDGDTSLWSYHLRYDRKYGSTQMETHLCDHTICDITENVEVIQMDENFNHYLIHNIDDNMIVPPHFRKHYLWYQGIYYFSSTFLMAWPLTWLKILNANLYGIFLPELLKILLFWGLFSLQRKWLIVFI